MSTQALQIHDLLLLNLCYICLSLCLSINSSISLVIIYLSSIYSHRYMQIQPTKSIYHCSYTYLFRADLWVLVILTGWRHSLSLKINSLSLSSHFAWCSLFGEDPCKICSLNVHPYCHVKWWHYCAGLVYTTILLSPQGYSFPVIYERHLSHSMHRDPLTLIVFYLLLWHSLSLRLLQVVNHMEKSLTWWFMAPLLVLKFIFTTNPHVLIAPERHGNVTD